MREERRENLGKTDRALKWVESGNLSSFFDKKRKGFHLKQHVFTFCKKNRETNNKQFEEEDDDDELQQQCFQ